MVLEFGRAPMMALALAFAGVAVGHAQNAPLPKNAAQAEAFPEVQRQQILESARWRDAEKKLNEWLAIQQIYSADEVAALRAQIADRVAKMSPDALESFLSEMEERLIVLTSPDADEARQWIAQILAVARNPESQFGGPLPDVANMTASEIRAELERFQQRRSSRQHAQAAFDRGRQKNAQTALNVHSARGATQPRTAATFPEASHRSPYTLHPEPLVPIRRRPIYRVGPWGEPIYWTPLNDWHPWRSGW